MNFNLRKLFLTAVILLIGLGSVFAQSSVISGFRVQSASGLPSLEEIETKQVSLHNVWIGSTFSYQLTGDANFNENFLFNANVLYDLQFQENSKWHFPIVGNLRLPLLEDGLNDISVGIYPWRIISSSPGGTVWVLHGGLSYKIQPGDELEVSPQQVTVLAGVEVSAPLRIGEQENLPLTISLAPTFHGYNLDRESSMGLQGTIIFPIAGNLGVIGDLNLPLFGKGQGTTTLFSAGVIVNGAL